jgi:hypothetical protein
VIIKIDMLSPLFLTVHGLILFCIFYGAVPFDNFIKSYLLFPLLIAFTYVISYVVLVAMIFALITLKAINKRWG